MELVSEIITLIFLLFLSGFFSGSEVALVSLTIHRAKVMAHDKKIGAKYINLLKENPQRMLSTILIGNNLVNVAASAITTSLMINAFESYAIGIATGIMTLLILVFGEITPKSIATHSNEEVSQFVAAPIWYLGIVLAPALMILDTFIKWFMFILGIRTEAKKITEDEIKSMVDTAQEEGSIKAMEKDLINNIFEFDDINVGEIATPRTDMISISSNATISSAINLCLKKTYSRMPVFSKSKDHIVGVIYLKDIIKYLTTNKKNMPVSKVMKKPYIVPSTKKISALLRLFQKRKDHMAIVVDEHGSITGLVTLEDVLEEIVGEILDETDMVDPHVKVIDKNRWEVQGKAGIEEINEKVGTTIKLDSSYDTLNGFILHRTGKIPRPGQGITVHGFRIKVQEMEEHRVTKVLITKR